MLAKYQVILDKPVTGVQLFEAVKTVAGRDYFEELSYADDRGAFYDIGRSSEDPSGDLTIGVGPKALSQVNPSGVYDEVYVLSCERGGEKLAVFVSNEAIAEAVRDFRDRLEEALK